MPVLQVNIELLESIANIPSLESIPACGARLGCGYTVTQIFNALQILYPSSTITTEDECLAALNAAARKGIFLKICPDMTSANVDTAECLTDAVAPRFNINHYMARVNNANIPYITYYYGKSRPLTLSVCGSSDDVNGMVSNASSMSFNAGASAGGWGGDACFSHSQSF